MDSHSDLVTLFTLVLGGSREARDSLLRGLEGGLRLYAYQALAGLPDRSGAAEDAKQEALLAIVRKLESPEPFTSLSDLRAYAAKVVQNRCHSQRRDQGRQPPAFADTAFQQALDSLSHSACIDDLVAMSGTSPVSGAHRRFQFARCMRLLDSLPDSYQEAIRLVIFLGLNSTQLGALIGKSRTAAAETFGRARKELARRMRLDDGMAGVAAAVTR